MRSVTSSLGWFVVLFVMQALPLRHGFGFGTATGFVLAGAIACSVLDRRTMRSVAGCPDAARGGRRPLVRPDPVSTASNAMLALAGGEC